MKKVEKSPKRLIIPLSYDKKFIAKGDGRRYHSSTLLSEGEYTDSISRTAVFYSGEELNKVASKLREVKLLFLWQGHSFLKPCYDFF